jgi:hypothetical protein
MLSQGTPQVGMGRKEKKETEQRIVQRIVGKCSDPNGQVTAWEQRAGMSGRTYYRVKQELGL